MLQIFDGLLLLVIVVLAWRSLNDRDLFRAVISFIALGLLIAVAWVRLRAPDVALAEAAVGSGLTGALILSALVRMRRRERAAAENPAGGDGMTSRVPVGVLSLALLAALGWAVLSLPSRPAGLTAASLAKLPESGVTNPVTAVLLNYRGYDTLLEVGVLLLAIVAVWSLRRGEWPASDLLDRPLLHVAVACGAAGARAGGGLPALDRRLRAGRGVPGRRVARRRHRPRDARRAGARACWRTTASCARDSCWG